MYILGIHVGHDSSAALVRDGEVLIDVQEERFVRIKHYAGIPLKSIEFCLKEEGITAEEIDLFSFTSRTLSWQVKLLFPNFDLRRKNLKGRTKRALFPMVKRLVSVQPYHRKLPTYIEPLRMDSSVRIEPVEHHLAHAASAYYTMDIAKDEKVLISTLDGMGDGVSSALWIGHKGRVQPLVKYGTESSLGWAYSNVTEALGWWHGDGEGTLMGLAAFGNPAIARAELEAFFPKFETGKLVEPHKFGRLSSFEVAGARQHHLLESEDILQLRKKYKDEDLAAAAQAIMEYQVKQLVLPWMDKLNTGNLACAGGLFLNVKLNQRLWETRKVRKQHIFPNAGDSGTAVGAALYSYYRRHPEANNVPLEHLYTGPQYSDETIKTILEDRQIPYTKSVNVTDEVAGDLADNRIIAWFQGRMESGPRALGNRSILMSPLRKENKDIINAKVKFRQPFRPFCPSILYESCDQYLKNARHEEYMITSFDVTDEKKDRVSAVVHADGTLRPQLVKKERNPIYHELIKQFGERTGETILLNTSLNIKGEPMICTPREAIRCFYDNGIDTLVLGSFIVRKDNKTS